MDDYRLYHGVSGSRQVCSCKFHKFIPELGAASVLHEEEPHALTVQLLLLRQGPGLWLHHLGKLLPAASLQFFQSSKKDSFAV